MLSLALDTLPGGEDAAGTPGSSGACVRGGGPWARCESAPRPARSAWARGPARTGDPGGPDRGRGDTRGPLQTLLPTPVP